MSIKTIEENYIGMDKGVAKKINKGAEKLVFDILQATQYSTPIPSTVRELVTNACDSQREKEIAIEILTGAKQVSDYYITRDGDQYSDSNFDHSYYVLPNLNITKNHIDITYTHREGVGYCDSLAIRDYGVGIGGKRLEGILELGYSTKRNTSQNFGAFGLGAKVALSTGVDFYTIETVYNGRRFKMNCFNYKTDFIIPKFNLVTGEINPSITLSDGSVVYYEDTIDQNWTEVSFGVKSHNSTRFIEAVEEQLNYLDNINFYQKYSDNDSPRKIDIKSEVIYNSDSLIVSTNNYLRKPHIVIVKEQGAATGINYGYVDFRELEMQDLYGAVGLKCPIRQTYIDDDGQEVVIQEGVEVTPSREKVIWSDSTKTFIQKLIDKAAEEVTDLVEKELLETDFLKWLDTCRQIIGGRATNKYSDDPSERTLAILSNIIDTKSIKPKYSPNPFIKFTSIPSTLNGFKVKIHNQTKNKSGELEYVSENVENWDGIGNRPIYYRTGRSNKYKDFYLYQQHGVFITIKKTDLKYLEEQIATAAIEDLPHYQSEYDKKVANQNLIEPLIVASELYKNYDDLVLPDNIKELYDGVQTQNMLASKGGLSLEEKRKLNQQIVVHSLRNGNRNNYWDLVWDKVEPTLSTVMSSTTPTYYCTDEDSHKLKLAAMFVSTHNAPYKKFVTSGYGGYLPYGETQDVCYYFDELPSRFSRERYNKLTNDFSGEIQLIKVSESNLKHFKGLSNYKHIDEFFFTLDEDDNYTCHPLVKNYANYLYGLNYRVFKSLTSFDDCFKLDFIDNRYSKIYEYMHNVYNKASFPKHNETEFLKEVTDFLQKLIEFEYAISTSPEELKEEVRERLSKEFFVFSDIPGAKVLDFKFIELVKFADEFTRDSIDFLPHVNMFVGNTEFTTQVTNYLKAVKALDIPVPDGV
jgi:hypothetical protein